MWLKNDKIIVKLWPNYGQNYGQTIKTLWPNYDKTIAKLWPNYGKTMAEL